MSFPDLKSYSPPHPTPPAALHKRWWRGGWGQGRRSLLTAIGVVTDAPKLLFHIDHLTRGGISSPLLGRGRAVLSCKCTARSALSGWRWINKHNDEHGGARCHSLAHLLPRSGHDWRQPPPADESALQPGWSYKSCYKTIGRGYHPRSILIPALLTVWPIPFCLSWTPLINSVISSCLLSNQTVSFSIKQSCLCD